MLIVLALEEEEVGGYRPKPIWILDKLCHKTPWHLHGQQSRTWWLDIPKVQLDIAQEDFTHTHQLTCGGSLVGTGGQRK